MPTVDPCRHSRRSPTTLARPLWLTKSQSLPVSVNGPGRTSCACARRIVSGRNNRSRSRLAAVGWVALAVLVGGLVVSAILLAPWKLKFAVDASDLYRELYEQAAAEAAADTLGWLAAAGFGYQKLRTENAKKVRRMSFLSGSFGVLVVAQTLAWLTALAIHS